jgi:membrane-bound serine protease (ClpP class)
LQFSLQKNINKALMRALLIFLIFTIGHLNLQADAEMERNLKSASAPEVTNVYIIPVEDVIDSPNLYILRRGLKEAIINEVSLVVLDMDTPGGRVDICLEMMEMLDRFEGETITYVNEDAISAGSFIAAATESIYFSPRGKIGASAVIQGTGEDVPETARQKIESYLRANIRVMSATHPYRAEVIRAMMRILN